jgi:hypothetical protein
MSDLIVKEVNAQTGEEVIREMTNEEAAAWFIQQELEQERLTAEAMKKEAAEEVLLSAKAKLASLGLTQEEAKLLLGGN